MSLNKQLMVAGGVIVFVVSATLLAQNALTQLGTTEAAAREWLFKKVEHGGPTWLVMYDDSQAARALAAFKKLPAGARAGVTTQLYAWAKGVVNSPAFKADYLKMREDQRPIERLHPGTVDDELKARIAKENADHEEAWKQMLAIGPQMKDIVDRQRKEWPGLREQVTPGWRVQIQETREKDKKDYETTKAFWEKNNPPDPLTLVARVLREFLDSTTDVDFAAKQEVGRNGFGEPVNVFVNDVYNKKPWQWKYAYEWGPEAIAAARTAAQGWLKEIGK